MTELSKSNQRLERKHLDRLLQAAHIEQISPARLTAWVETEPGLADYAPEGICQIDPRSGDRILYNSARAQRPHDNKPASEEAEPDQPSPEKACVVCSGKTTGIIDVADLSEGFTFINKNLYPVLFPAADNTPSSSRAADPTAGQPAHGLHLLQWTSSHHERDWHNMPQSDRVIVLQRLAALEQMLLAERDGYISIIKNCGHLVGGSLVHGHQQIGYSNVMPRRFLDNYHFLQEQGQPFAAYMLRENPPALAIKDYGPALLLTPYFMRRPFDMMLILKDTQKQHLYQLTEPELVAVADGWRDAITIILQVMPALGREIAYNVITHNGPGAGLYFEFLPYTQESGGFERLGLLVCQANPRDTAELARQVLADHNQHNPPE